MRSSRGESRLVWYQGLGFAVIIVISWLNELIGLPGLLFGGGPPYSWKESALETGVVLTVAIPTLLVTSRLSRRLYRLEGFLRLCAWCRRIELDGRWVPVEEFVAHRLDMATSHGICPDCEVSMTVAEPPAQGLLPTSSSSGTGRPPGR
jgi:hypothetical protein